MVEDEHTYFTSIHKQRQEFFQVQCQYRQRPVQNKCFLITGTTVLEFCYVDRPHLNHTKQNKKSTKHSRQLLVPHFCVYFIPRKLKSLSHRYLEPSFDNLWPQNINIIMSFMALAWFRVANDDIKAPVCLSMSVQLIIQNLELFA